MATPRPNCLRSCLQSGFTMLEVLIAMGIFAVGFAAVAAIFPTAVMLQKQTVDDVLSQQVARNAQAMLEARGLSVADINHASVLGTTSWMTDQRVYPISTLLDVPVAANKWLLADRSYPSTTNPPESRRIFWVPLVRDADSNPADEMSMVYVFVLQKEADATYTRPVNFTAHPILGDPDNWANPDDPATTPGVVRLTGVSVDVADQRFNLGTNNNRYNGNFILKPGDQFLDEFGQIHTVHTANADSVTVTGIITPNMDTGEEPDEIWFAAPSTSGRLRPLRKIITLTDVVN